MKVVDLIKQVDKDMPNSLDIDRKIDFINEVEQSIYSTIVEEYKGYTIDAVKDQELYTMVDYTIEDISILRFDGTEYTKLNLMYNEPLSFFKKDGKIALNPIPTEDKLGAITVIVRSRPVLKTADKADADNLELPEQFVKLYNAYLNSQIAIRQRDFAIGNNWSSVYNSYLDDFVKWYNDNKPKLNGIKKNKAWK